MTSRVCILLLFSSFALAQFDGVNRPVRVQLAFSNGVCDSSTRVRLTGLGAPPVDAAPDKQCEVSFSVPDGTYVVHVSGQTIGDTESVIAASPGSSDFEVRVRPSAEPANMSAMVMSPSISVTDLRVPEKAQKELHKASKEIDRKDFAKALRTVQHAIDVYPEYADAYNNLGVIYARLGDRERERQALEKAISLNDRLAPAYANLGRLNINTGDFAGAETVLKKASACEPLNGITLLLLAYAQFMQKDLDAAIETSRHAHDLQSTHAFAHQIAARAFEQKRDATSAIAELQLFLKEEPSGPRADSARKELAIVEAVPH